MSCDDIASELPLYVYGELTQEEEERVEQHLLSCGSCAAELARLRLLGRALSMAESPVPDDLLSACRGELGRTVRALGGSPGVPRQSWFERAEARIHEFMNMGVGFRIPAGALALVAAGFLAGRFAPGTIPFITTGAQQTGAQQAGFVNVRSVEPDGAGKVRIAFDSVSRKTLDGSPNDPEVRRLLLASLHDESNAGLRVEAAAVIKDHCAQADIRNALLEAVQHDPNVGVRMVALDGLKSFSGDPAVRRALTETLLNDANPGVRVKVIDLLTTQKDENMVGALQNVMRKESNNYVRMRVSSALRSMNASVGTF